MHFLPSQSFSLNSSAVRDRISVSRSLCLTINYIYVKLQWNEIASWLPIIKGRVHTYNATIYMYIAAKVNCFKILCKYINHIMLIMIMMFTWSTWRVPTKTSLHTVCHSLRPQPLLPNYTVVLVDSTYMDLV